LVRPIRTSFKVQLLLLEWWAQLAFWLDENQ